MDKRQNSILIVDDDPHILELLSVNISAAGYALDTATNGGEALSRIAQRRYDCIILDVMMPHKDGWEVCKAVRDDPSMEGVKLLFLTAKDTGKDRMIGTQILGADDYVSKPFDIPHLLECIERLLYG